MTGPRRVGRGIIAAAVLFAAPAAAVTLSLDEAAVLAPGDTGTFTATLVSEGASVAAVSATIRLASGLAPVRRAGGEVDCVAGPETGKMRVRHHPARGRIAVRDLQLQCHARAGAVAHGQQPDPRRDAVHLRHRG